MIIEADTVVVGAGPAGYCAAIALARNGFTDIHIIERCPAAEWHNPSKAYSYVLFPFAKDVLRDVLGVDLEDSPGVTVDGFTSVVLLPDGTCTESVIKEEVKGVAAAPAEDCFTWVPRHTFNAYLHAFVHQKFKGTIHVHFGLGVSEVYLPPSSPHDGLICAKAVATDAAEHTQHTFVCRLLVGADGMASRVHRELARTRPNQGWGQRAFPLSTRPGSWKVLSVDASVPLAAKVGALRSDAVTTLVGVERPGNKRIQLTFLPDDDPSQTRLRTCVISLPPEDALWSVASVDGLYKTLERNFPQVQSWRRFVPHDIADQFVRECAASFPMPRMTKRLVACFPTASRDQNPAATMLIGDAAHSFPPDIGQGVNAAMLDVRSLNASLKLFPGNLLNALCEYQQRRMPENKALMRLAQIGVPSSHEAAHFWIQRRVLAINYAWRCKASKIIPAVIAPPTARMLSAPRRDVRRFRPEQLYQEALQSANRTTMFLWAAFVATGALLAAIMRKVI